MQQTTVFGCEFWNDSCDPNQLREACAASATGATSNPVIVFNVLNENPQIATPLIDGLIKSKPAADEDVIAWLAIEQLGRQASNILLDVYEKSDGQRGKPRRSKT